MAQALKEYVEKNLLTPSVKINIDDDGNEATRARISNKIIGKEGNRGIGQRTSKLRAQNASTLAERDPKYKGVKVSRASCQQPKSKVDPELQKLLYDMESDSDVGDDSSDAFDDKECEVDTKSSEDDDEESKEKLIQLGRNLKAIKKKVTDQKKKTAKVAEASESSENEDADSGLDEESEIESDASENSFDDTSFEQALGQVDSQESGEEENEEKQSTQVIKRLQISKEQGISVKNQTLLFSQLVELRNTLHKVLPLCNQLPQYDKFGSFKKHSELKEMVLIARKTAKKLILKILMLQDSLTQLNSKLSEDLYVNMSKESTALSESKKRSIEDFESCLAKRHKACTPYRDSVLNECHNNASLLSKASYDEFKAFEVSASTQLRNILSDKEPLIKRTQLRSVTRGSTYKILGKETEQVGDEYDAEIFDDTDFYRSLALDVTHCNKTTEKEKVESKDSGNGKQRRKKRKLRSDPIKPLIGFTKPSKSYTVEDAEIDNLIKSIFQSSVN